MERKRLNHILNISFNPILISSFKYAYCYSQLSPALRNRFVEIWCPVATTRKSYKQIIDHNLNHFQMDTGEAQ